jgi:hypothetical protein
MPLRALWALINKLNPIGPPPALANPSDKPPKWQVEVANGVKLSSRDLDRVQTSCVAASLLEENAVRPTAEQPRNHGASLTIFFNIRVDRVVNGCSLSVLPKVTSLRPDNLTPQELADQKAVLDLLNVLLEGPGYGDSPDQPVTAVYGYSLSPRLRQNVEVRRDTRDSASAATKQAGGSFNRNRGLDYRGVEPEVVGFMRSTQAAATSRGARFGWLMTPRPGRENSYSVPLEQAELSAVVALPSWWRSALLQICTRFVSQENMGDVYNDEFWNHRDRCRVEMIRLPGSPSDISRHLGMDVLTTPYMDVWRTPPMLVAGPAAETTQLVITGERLWRNTVVTLGGQKADSIQVLPDMVGIAATFRCIRRPTTGFLQLDGMSGVGAAVTLPVASASKGPTANPPPPQTASYSVPVTVWTSEGHTDPQFANVAVDLRDTAKPCPSEATDAGRAP